MQSYKKRGGIPEGEKPFFRSDDAYGRPGTGRGGRGGNRGGPDNRGRGGNSRGGRGGADRANQDTRDQKRDGAQPNRQNTRKPLDENSYQWRYRNEERPVYEKMTVTLETKIPELPEEILKRPSKDEFDKKMKE